MPFSIRRPFSALFLLAALTAALPAAAVEIGNDSYMLTFGDGWKDYTIASGNHAATAIKGEYGEQGFVTFSLLTHAGTLSPSELALYMKSYRQTDSVITIDQGSKTLGDKVFSYVEWMDGAPEDPGAEAPHFRLYLTTQGGLLFEAITYFTPSQNGGEVAEVESALATLNITASAGVRPVAASTRSGLRPGLCDGLGRIRTQTDGKTPVFFKPNGF